MKANRRIQSQKLNRYIKRLQRRVNRLTSQSQFLSSLRMGVFLTSVVLVWLTGYVDSRFYQVVIPGAGGVIFLMLVVQHYRVREKIKTYQTWLKIKRGQYAQMRMDWPNLLHANPEGTATHQPTDRDLNLTGPKSIHHLIDFTISTDGSRLLHDWLMAEHPDLKTLHARQKMVQELLITPRFRERFLLSYYRSAEKQICSTTLMAWLTHKQGISGLIWYLRLSLILCGTGWILFYLFAAGLLPAYWVFALFLYICLYTLKRSTIIAAMEEIQMLDDELTKLRPVLQFLETYDYHGLPETRKICRPLITPEAIPSKALRSVKLYASAIGLRMNPLMALFLNGVMPWDILFTYLIEKQKDQLNIKFPIWMASVYQLEALISLANFAYVNPHYSFPQLLATGSTAPVFRADSIGHPLIPDDKKVRNDFSFKKLGHVSIITGSNMTGKSTFLKTIGINLRLAYAGGPVDAKFMSTQLFSVMTCIQISDSLAEETSYFYAEVKRLKKILTAVENRSQTPVFFLIDEILKGTNNLERYLGSKPYINAVSESNGVGLITTHDLELYKLADHCPSISNHHFGDAINDGKFIFDYQIKPGVSTSTNALIILKNEGLPVDTITDTDSKKAE